MGKSRLEAFSDGVLAIILTIMVLEMKVPQGDTLSALQPLWGVFVSYVLSFVFIGFIGTIIITCCTQFSTFQPVFCGPIFTSCSGCRWCHLQPTGWVGTTSPRCLRLCTGLMAGIAYSLLTRAIIRSQGSGSLLSKAVGKSRKGNVSLALYAFAVAVALWAPYVAGLIYALVAVMWLIPDRRIERALGERSQ